MTAKSKLFFTFSNKFIIIQLSIMLLYTAALGVPIKLLHEAESHIVTVEMKNGEAYRGLLEEAEDTMNCKLTEGNELLTD